MEEPIHRVEISGAVLAAMLRECASSRGDCDGLLFGRWLKRSIQNFQDEDDQGTVTESTAIVTGCCCTGTVMSFYDATGDVESDELERMLGDRHRWGGDQVIGWLLSRRNTAMRPSMRETAVSASLAGWSPPVNGGRRRVPVNGRNPKAVGSGLIPYSLSSDDSSSIGSSGCELQEQPAKQVPRLFFLLTEFEVDKIWTHEYRAFEFRGDDGLQPRTMVVRNVGHQSGVSDEQRQRGVYGSFVPVAPIPGLSSAKSSTEVDSLRGEKKPASNKSRDQELLGMYTSGFSLERLQGLAKHGDVYEIEHLYRSVLSRFEQLSRQVRESSAAVYEQEKLNARLKASLAGGQI